MVERRSPKPNVVGSNPSGPATILTVEGCFIKEVGFVKGAAEEASRVDWPSNLLVVKATLLIVAIVVLSTVYVGGLDFLFSKVILVMKSFLSY